MKKRISNCLVLTVFPLFLVAQKQVEHQSLTWFAYFNTFRLNDHYFFFTELQERRFIHPSAQHQFLGRTTFRKTLGEGLDAGIGICLFLQEPHDPETEERLAVPEWRPHMEMNLVKSVNQLKINQRCRMEARYFHNTTVDQQALRDGYSFGNFRLRYQLELVVPIVKILEKRLLKFKLGDEVMFNFGKRIIYNLFDQNRLQASARLEWTKSFALEAGYLNWFQQQKSGVDYYNRDIVRFALFQTINPKRDQ